MITNNFILEQAQQTWKEDLKAYEASRTNWTGMPERDIRITTKDVKAMETKYNPIT